MNKFNNSLYSISETSGHNINDTGAVANGRYENIETIRVRNRVKQILDEKGITVYVNNDNENLINRISRIKTLNTKINVEWHFNAFNGFARGCEALVCNNANQASKMLATDLCRETALLLNIPNRGVKSESESKRGTLAFTKIPGITVLFEICFIDNKEDMNAYDSNFDALCKIFSDIIIKHNK